MVSKHLARVLLLAGSMLMSISDALQPSNTSPNSSFDDAVVVSRRSVLGVCGAVATLVSLPTSPSFAAAGPNGLPLQTSSTGIKWADAKVGTGQPLRTGEPASVDYSMASTAGRFPQIYTTKDKGEPYRWTLGDGSTIAGIETAIVGSEDVPPMLPGGIRRVIVPASLGYQPNLVQNNQKCIEKVGPIPPNVDGAYQRWVQFYCNPRIPYQPDLVLDIKLYGKRKL